LSTTCSSATRSNNCAFDRDLPGDHGAKLAVSYASTRLDAAIIAQITQSVRVDLYRHAMKLSPER